MSGLHLKGYLFVISLLLALRDSEEIVNGIKTVVGKFPYMAQVRVDGNAYGAGVILNEQWILTTAFNVKWYNVANLEIRVGTNLANTNRGQLLEVEQVVVHENYEQQSDYDYDIAVVKVSKPMTFGKKINKISISQSGLNVKQSIVFGWGQPNITEVPSPILLRTKVTLLDWNTCKNTYGSELTDRMICSFDYNVGPCMYDFGAPLIHENKVYGLYSGSKVCLPGYTPAIYTDLSKLYDWVQNAIKS